MEEPGPTGDQAGRDAAGELRRMNWALRAYARCSSALIRPNTPAELMKNVCEAIVDADAYLLAFVGVVESTPSRTVRIEAQAGQAVEYANGLVLSGSEDHPAGRGATGRAIRAGAAMIILDSTLDPTYSYWRERGLAFGIRSSVTLPFKRGNDVVGILNVYGAQPNAFGREEMDLFEQLGAELAFALALSENRGRLEAAERARRAAEERARRAEAELARVSRISLAGELAASIAHELGQPLTAINSSNAAALRWLAHEPPNVDEARNALARTARDVKRAVDVVKRTHTLVMKGSPAEHLDFDLNDAIAEVVQIVSDRLRTADVACTLDLDRALAPVRGDRTQIQQVALNLILNSVDAMVAVTTRPRSIAVRTERTSAGDALFELGDSGVGFENGAEERVFDQFYTTKDEGLGLGLSISKSIILAHDGILTAAQGTPFGAIFQFTLFASTHT